MQIEERKALIGFIVEIEASRERAKGETRHQSEIFKKAKEKNFDNKAMRKVLQRRAMSKNDREQLDDLVDQYEHALGGLALAKEAVSAGMSAREAAAKYNVPRAALGVIVGGSKNAIFEPVAKVTVITPPDVAALPAHAPRDAAGNQLQCNNDGVIIEESHGEDVRDSGRDVAGSLGADADARGAVDADLPRGSAATACAVDAEPSHAEGAGASASAPQSQGAPSAATEVDLSSPKAPDARATEFTNDPGGDHVTAPADTNPNALTTDCESPAGGENPVPSAGDCHDERRLNAEPEVAGSVPPATDPDEDDLAIPLFLRGTAVPGHAA